VVIGDGGVGKTSLIKKFTHGTFKEAYIKSFLKLGYTVVYVGNGDSDVAPAQYAHYIFATGELLVYCRENNLKHEPFENLIEVVMNLERMSQVQL